MGVEGEGGGGGEGGWRRCPCGCGAGEAGRRNPSIVLSSGAVTVLFREWEVISGKLFPLRSQFSSYLRSLS